MPNNFSYCFIACTILIYYESVSFGLSLRVPKREKKNTEINGWECLVKVLAIDF